MLVAQIAIVEHLDGAVRIVAIVPGPAPTTLVRRLALAPAFAAAIAQHLDDDHRRPLAGGLRRCRRLLRRGRGVRRTGHAWFGRLALRKVESSYLLTEYKITGYGYRIIGGASCQRWIEGPYSIIQPFVPTSVHQLLSAWYCNAPVIGAEGPQIEVPAGQPLPKVSTPAEVNKMLGVNKPEVLLAVAINKEQFNNIQFLVDKQIKDPRPYQLLYHDCTTFVRELAASIGLYVRPRILAAFPSETVYALMLDNLRSDEIPSGLDAKQ